MGTGGLKILGYTFGYPESWGWRIWFPLGLVALIALLWTRSLQPLKKLFQNAWEDWTQLSLAMYAFLAWFSLLYDENHHPYLLVFMLVSTLVTAASVWFFLHSSSIAGRILVLLGGFGLGIVIGGINEATWDWRAYYGLPPVNVPWYFTLLRWVIVLAVYGLFIFWPAALEIFRKIRQQRKVLP